MVAASKARYLAIRSSYMTSKTYFTLTGVFIVCYLLTSFGVIAGLPEWLHQVCTFLFAGAVLLGVRKKKEEGGR